MKTLFNMIAVVSLALLSNLATAEQKQVFGDFEVHYMVMPSSELDKEVARQYGIPRSRQLGYITLSVLKKGVDVMPVAWNAEITGTLANLIGQQKTLSFKRIQETGALYFFTTFDYLDDNIYRFNIQVTPEGDKREYDLKFSKHLYHGE